MLHFAALSLVGESQRVPEQYWRGNVVGALNLLDAMRAADVKRIVFSSTAATYGEPDVELITEDTPNVPVNTYGNSKLAIDRMLTDEARAHGIAAVSLRYFNVAGASGPLGEDHEPETHLIPLVLQAAAGRRESIGDLRHGLPDGRRQRGARLHPRRRPRRGARARRGQGGAGAARHLQPRLRDAATRCGEVIETARAVTGREIVAVEQDRRAGDPPRLVASNARARRRARLGAGEDARGHDPGRVGVALRPPGRLLSQQLQQ